MAKLRTFEKVERGLIRKKLDQIPDLEKEEREWPDINWLEDDIVKENIEKVKNLDEVNCLFVSSCINGGLGVFSQINAEDYAHNVLVLLYHQYTRPDIYRFILKHLGQNLFNEINNKFIKVNDGEYLINPHNIDRVIFPEKDINYPSTDITIKFKNDCISILISNENYEKEKVSIKKQIERVKYLNCNATNVEISEIN